MSGGLFEEVGEQISGLERKLKSVKTDLKN